LSIDRAERLVALDDSRAFLRIGVDVVVEVLGQQLLDRVAEHLRERRVRVVDLSVLGRAVHPQRRSIEDRVEFLLGIHHRAAL
jgi:hypothetical protein